MGCFLYAVVPNKIISVDDVVISVDDVFISVDYVFFKYLLMMFFLSIC